MKPPVVIVVILAAALLAGTCGGGAGIWIGENLGHAQLEAEQTRTQGYQQAALKLEQALSEQKEQMKLANQQIEIGNANMAACNNAFQQAQARIQQQAQAGQIPPQAADAALLILKTLLR